MTQPAEFGGVSDAQRQPGQCRSCHAPIEWGLSKAGKRTPFDLDGQSHFRTCPEASQWSRKNQPKNPR